MKPSHFPSKNNDITLISRSPEVELLNKQYRLQLPLLVSAAALLDPFAATSSQMR